MPIKFATYTLATQLGKTSLSDTYLASASGKSKRKVVIKVFHATCLRPGYEARDFLQDVARFQHFKHPHLVSLFDGGIEQGQPFIVRPYFSRGSLRNQLQMLPSQRLPVAQTLRMGIQIGQALSYCHDNGLLHGHITLDNVLLKSDEHALLGDFGLAALIDESVSGDTASLHTGSYHVPELLSGPGSQKSDQFSLGGFIYETLTGVSPFGLLEPAVALSDPYTKLPLPPSQLIANVSEPLEKVLLKALASDPSARYESVAQLVEALQALPEADVARATAYKEPESDPLSPAFRVAAPGQSSGRGYVEMASPSLSEQSVIAWREENAAQQAARRGQPVLSPGQGQEEEDAQPPALPFEWLKWLNDMTAPSASSKKEEEEVEVPFPWFSSEKKEAELVSKEEEEVPFPWASSRKKEAELVSKEEEVELSQWFLAEEKPELAQPPFGKEDKSQRSQWSDEEAKSERSDLSGKEKEGEHSQLIRRSSIELKNRGVYHDVLLSPPASTSTVQLASVPGAIASSVSPPAPVPISQSPSGNIGTRRSPSEKGSSPIPVSPVSSAQPQGAPVAQGFRLGKRFYALLSVALICMVVTAFFATGHSGTPILTVLYLVGQFLYLPTFATMLYYFTRPINWVNTAKAAKLAERDLPKIILLYPVLKELEETMRTTLLGLSKLEYPPTRYRVIAIPNSNDGITIASLHRLEKEFPFLKTLKVPPTTDPRWEPVWKAWETNPKAYWWHQGKYQNNRDLPPKKTRQLIYAFYTLLDKIGDDWLLDYIDADSVPPTDHFLAAAAGMQKYDVLQSTNVAGNLLDTWAASFHAMDHMAWDGLIYPHMSANGEHPFWVLGKGLFFKASDIREIGSFNPWITIEDPEVGMRLWKNGKKIGIIANPLIEEVPVTFKIGIIQRSRWVCGFFQSLSTPLNRMGMSFWQAQKARLNILPCLSLTVNVVALPLGMWALYEWFNGTSPLSVYWVGLSMFNIASYILLMTRIYIATWQRTSLVLSHFWDRVRYLIRVNPIFLWVYWLIWIIPICIGFQMFLRDRGQEWIRTEKVDANHALVREKQKIEEAIKAQVAKEEVIETMMS
jgi:serine/threonine protein kinase/cellulose synthase/poly-beta-1,6-N-acetylglucosamine synthase-like glycosyltransferase